MSEPGCPITEHYPIPNWEKPEAAEEPLFSGEPTVERGQVRLSEEPGFGCDPSERLLEHLKVASSRT
jgi:L-alanine-DL-glutamate epimerase-like enolase superfamily enzyme